MALALGTLLLGPTGCAMVLKGAHSNIRATLHPVAATPDSSHAR